MQQRVGMLCLAGAFALAGTSVVAARMIGPALGVFTTAATSLLVALPVLLLACRRKLAASIRGMDRRDWLLVALQAFFGIFLFRMFLLHGVKRTSAAEAGILTGATPAATALMAGLLLREPVGRVRALGVASTVAGVTLLQGLSYPGHGFAAAHVWGNLLVLLAAVSESSFNILSRAGYLRAGRSQKPAPDPVCQTALVTAAALLLCAVPALLERPLAGLLALNASGWLALLWYGLFVTAAAFILWYSGIRRCQASTAAAFSGLMPLTAVALSIMLLGERPGWPQWIGGLLVTSGMLLSGRGNRLAQPRAAGPMEEVLEKK